MTRFECWRRWRLQRRLARIFGGPAPCPCELWRTRAGSIDAVPASADGSWELRCLIRAREGRGAILRFCRGGVSFEVALTAEATGHLHALIEHHVRSFQAAGSEGMFSPAVEMPSNPSSLPEARSTAAVSE